MLLHLSRILISLTILTALASSAAWSQPPARKPIANADVVRMVRAGLSQDIILRAIRKGPTRFDTDPSELIALKQQGVPEAVVHAMMDAAEPPPEPAPAAPAPPAPPLQNPAPEVVWVTFYGVCPKGDIIIFKPTIYANQRELARLACNTFFHTVAQPGTYKFCATKGKCRTAVLKVGAPYAFRILPTTISYSIAPVSAEEADAEIREQSISPLDPKRFLAPDLVTVDGDKAPPSILVP